MAGPQDHSWGDGRSAADGLEELRRDLLNNLPGLLDRAISTYGRFATETPPEDSKGFVAYQTGCRAALTHIHLLVRLAHWARAAYDEQAADRECEQLDLLVREAEAALNSEPIED
ncbi:MAG: hypothetical protein IPK78_01375 [Rhodospirillales bacterium]|nr:hypothetical protein [Rhodospirillales bacterium]